jgi:hypothetical protein
VTDPIGRVRGRYATTIGGKHNAPSVSTVLSTLNKPGLPWGAAKETALFAVFHQDEWIGLDEKEAVDRLRRHHRGVWDDQAQRGTIVHDLALQWSKGQEVDVPADCDPYMDALDAFYRENAPTFVEMEQSVIYDEKGHEFGGSFDAIIKFGAGEFAGRTLIVDYKTGQRYPIETTLQLSAYRSCKKIGVYDEKGQLVGTRPMVPVGGGAILYLHDDGTYELLEVPANGDAFAVFLRLRAVWAWNNEMERWVKAHPERRAGAKEVAA